MDELELRRRLLADPNSTDKDLLDAVNKDDKSKQLADDLKAFDQQIAKAMNVDVPENLANKLILKQTIHSHQHNKRRTRVHLALAASVALFAAVGVSWVSLTPAHNNMADYAIAHYHHDTPTPAGVQMSLASINERLGGLDVKFAEAIGELIAIDECFYDGMDSMHLVFEGQFDNITMFIIPKKEHLAYRQEFSQDNIHGVIKQFENASVIIMGDKREQLDDWQQKVEKNIEFSI